MMGEICYSVDVHHHKKGFPFSIEWKAFYNVYRVRRPMCLSTSFKWLKIVSKI